MVPKTTHRPWPAFQGSSKLELLVAPLGALRQSKAFQMQTRIEPLGPLIGIPLTPKPPTLESAKDVS